MLREKKKPPTYNCTQQNYSSKGRNRDFLNKNWGSRYTLCLSSKESIGNAGDTGEVGLIPGLGRSPRGENGNPLQYSCLENPMDRGTWWATVHGSQRVGHDWATNTFCFLSSLLLLENIPNWEYWEVIQLTSICHASVCSSILCLVTTKIWSDRH